MVYILYNKVLLRILVVLCGMGVGLSAWFYISLSAQKLQAQGVRDALAIVSFLIAGWLVMVIAEVVDNHYVRAFAALCVILGGLVSFRWIFLVDGPKLRELEAGGGGMLNVTAGYWAAMLLALALFCLLVTRLVMDKLSSGRRPVRSVGVDAVLGPQPAGLGEPPPPATLAQIPVDTAPLSVTAEPQPVRTVGPVARLRCIGGMYMDSVFELHPGEIKIGRSNTEIELGNDNQVSRTHAIINVDPQGLARLSDAGSTNGTFVDDQRIQQIELAPGDVIRIGTSLFKAEG